MERILEHTNQTVIVYDTDKRSLSELFIKEFTLSCRWRNYYIFKLKSDDKYDAQVFIVNINTKKVEWGYFTSLGILAIDEGKEVTSEEIKELLS